MRQAFFLLSFLLTAGNASAQAGVDTVFTWQAYAREGTLHLRLFANPADAERPHTIVIREVAENSGPTTVDDSRHLVELIGRRLSVEPDHATWIFHWGSFSFPEGRGGKQLFLRATFRRTRSGALSTPTWRVLAREEVEDLTARQYP